MRKTEQSKEWETKIADFQSSGQTMSAWCATNNLKVHQLKYWLGKQRNQNQPTTKTAQWLSLEIKDPVIERKELPLLVKVGSITIEVHPGFNAKLLLDVVKTLSTTTC